MNDKGHLWVAHHGCGGDQRLVGFHAVALVKLSQLLGLMFGVIGQLAAFHIEFTGDQIVLG